MGLKVLSLENDLVAALEKEDTFDNMVKSKGIMGKIFWRSVKFLVGRIGFMPTMYFEREDLDDKVVYALLKHPKLLASVVKWIEEVDYSVVPDLREAKKVFERIQKPKKRDSKLYRAFNIKGDQQSLGLGNENKDVKPGEKFTWLVDKPLSFSSYDHVTQVYGKVRVTVDYAKEDKRMFHITNEILMAAIMSEEGATDIDASFQSERMFCYFESIFLPDGKSLEFTLQNK